MLKTGINFNDHGFKTDSDTLMRVIAEAGFDTFFCGWTADDNVTAKLCELGAKYGVRYESMHAPFVGMYHIWEDNEKGVAWVDKLKAVIDTCHRFGIGYTTVHATNMPQFNNNGPIGSHYNELGAGRFATVAEYAAKRGVKIAIENTEFPQKEMLSLVRFLEERGLEKGFGTLWDVGHWNCYPAPEGFDFADNFGKHLIGTHVHDNFGQKDPQVITWNDDSHVLPFDGTIDYRRIGDAMKRSNYQGTITLEVFKNHCHDLTWYNDYTLESFYRDAHDRAVHLARLCE